MNAIMIDIETLDTTPAAVVLSIGAVAFNTDAPLYLQPLQSFYEKLEIQGQIDAGRSISGDTLTWWLQQANELRGNLFDENGIGFETVCNLFSEWIEETVVDKDDLTVWGNGAGFDNVIVETLYRDANQALPWPYWSNRCYRTLNKHLTKTESAKLYGDKHNALHDALSQTTHLLKLLHPDDNRPIDQDDTVIIRTIEKYLQSHGDNILLVSHCFTESESHEGVFSVNVLVKDINKVMPIEMVYREEERFGLETPEQVGELLAKDIHAFIDANKYN